MKGTTVWRSLGPVDARSVRRDAMLRWMIFLPVVLTLAIRFILPLLVVRLGQWLPFDLQALYPPLMGALYFLMIPFLWGMVGGFLLLDERDDRTLTALQITPLPMSHYLLYRLALPSLLSAGSTALLFPLAGLGTLPVLKLVLLAMVAAPLAPLIALLLAALAQNKVQGLALTKASGLLIFPAIAAYFVPPPWHWLLAPVPTYWPTQAFWQALENDALFWLTLTGGFVYQLLCIMLLARRFERIMHR